MRSLAGLCLALAMGCGWAQTDPFPKIASAYWVETNGAPVWSRQAERPLAPASLTKMMTALLALEYAPTPPALKEPVRASAAAARETGTRIGLGAGQQVTVGDLLAATLVASANDACRALADHVAGEQRRFVQRMNRRAQQLGMRHTHFTNACGHDDPHHYASAHDLALLAHALVQHPQALEWTQTRTMEIRTVDGLRHFPLANTNALIGRYSGALGLKTGHTPGAGNCLVALARRGSTQVVLVLLKGSDRWWDAVDVLDLAFERAAHAS